MDWIDGINSKTVSNIIITTLGLLFLAENIVISKDIKDPKM